MKKILLFLVILSECLLAQIGNPGEESKKVMVPNFFIEALSNRSTQAGKTRLDVYIQVPFSNVQFIRKDTTFTASYTATLTISDEDKENVFYDQNWIEKLKTDDFNEANSPFSSNYSMRSIDLKPGKYMLYCSIEDGDSKKLTFNQAVLTVRGFSDSLDISDALLIEQVIKDKDAEQMIPNIARVITNKTTELPVYFEVYSDKSQLYTFDYILKDKDGNVLCSKTEDKNVNTGVNKIFYTLKDIKFALGEIQLCINIKKGDKDLKNYIKIISGRIYNLPLSINSMDDAIDQMAYIASGAIINDIRNTPNNEEKIKKFFDFWDSKKPTKASEENPLMKEYYNRVEYSNKHFKGRPAGWKSDMGMVYIILGPPETVQREPMPINSRPYEVWIYSHLNREYVFLDVGGFGSYQLQNPDYDLLNGGNIR